MISLHHLHKSFGPNPVLRGIDLEFNTPGVTAVLGPNGSGKTTLIKSILGMVLPDEGEVRFRGKSIKGQWAYRQEIDYLPQIARFPENLTVLELLQMIKDLRGKDTRDEALISRFELKPYLQKQLRYLSGGTRQKVNLVLAFMYDSPLLILDEPTSGLDPVAMIRLKELIREERDKGKIILITTHIMHFVEEIADELVFLLEGNIYFKGSVKLLLEQQGTTDLEHAIAGILSGDIIHTEDTENSSAEGRIFISTLSANPSATSA